MIAKAGVENAQVIDLVTHDPKSDRIVLIMVENRPLDGSEQRLVELQDKINSYLSFALDGELAKRYPDCRDKRVRIQIDCDKEPDAETTKFFDRMRRALSGHDVELLINQLG